MNRHPLDLFSLLSGLVLSGIALAALFGVSTTVAGWVWPTALVAVGVVVVAAAVGTATHDDTAGVATTSDPDHDMALAAARDEVEESDHTTA